MYVEVAEGVRKRGIMIAPESIVKFIKPEKELYKSYFMYENTEIEEYADKIHINHIILDIDRGKETLEKTLDKTRELVNRLIKEFGLEENLAIWFSGTGFHVHIPDVFGFEPSLVLPIAVRNTIERHFPEADTKPIQKRGLIRVGYSYNKKSRLYKTYIPEEEIWGITPTQIIEMASEFRFGMDDLPRLSKPDKLFPELIVKEETRLRVSTFKPTRVVPCMQRCYNEGAIVGTRHQRILRLASWLKRQAIPLSGAVAMMENYVKNTEYSFKQLKVDVESIYAKDYAYGCNDTVMKQFCTSDCIFYEKKNFIPEVATANDIVRDYIDFIKSDWKEVSLNIGKFFGVHDHWLVPEDLVGVIGATGLNKTALIQNLVVSAKDKSILYISTEFSNRLLLRRFLQIDLGIDKDDVNDLLKAKSEQFEEVVQGIKHVSFTHSTPGYLELEKLIQRFRPNILVIDTIDDIKHEKLKGLEGEEKVATGLKDLSRKYKLITIAVHHISKHAAYDKDGSPKELNVNSGKGASSFEQKCDVVIGIQGLQDKPNRNIRTLKVRDNAPFNVDVIFYMDTFKFKKIGEKYV